MRTIWRWIRLAVLMALAAPAGAGSPNTSASSKSSSFQKLGTAVGTGEILASVVGPGPSAGSQRLYESYIYNGSTFDLVAIDPQTGAFHVYENPAPSSAGAWGLTLGPDGDMYVGTLPDARILRLDPRTGAYTDLGRASSTEQYINSMAVGSDGRIYGSTYPSSKLVRVDPRTGKLEDLGRMDPREQYGTPLAVSDDGFVYVGIGTSRRNLAAYEIATGEHREILPEQYQSAGRTSVVQGADGKVYAWVVSPDWKMGQAFKLDGFKITPIAASELAPGKLTNQLADGRTVKVSGNTIEVTDPAIKKVVTHPFAYPGRKLPIFRVTTGPDGNVYGSTDMSAHLLRFDPNNSAVENVGLVGQGEVYSFLNHKDRLLMGTYVCDAPLVSFDPAKPFKSGPNLNDNPLLVNFTGSNQSWRPMAMAAGADGLIYVGAVPGYGLLGGPLVTWDTTNNQVKQYEEVVPDQSVVSLVAAGKVIAGGCAVNGGGGSHPTATSAVLFLWNPQKQQKIFEATPVPGATGITDLTMADGKLFGVADSTLFVFDVASRKLLYTHAEPISGFVYNSLAAGPDEKLWGLFAQGIFSVDPKTYQLQVEAHSPVPITAGFALKGNHLFFGSSTDLYRYRIERSSAPAAKSPTE
jgi:outer membrane protein assembly factor BamB